MRALIAICISAAAAVALAHWPAPPLPDGVKADKVVVKKSARLLALYKGDRLLRAYRVALGGDAIGPKHEEGDERTPEGRYVLDYRNPHSAYHLSLHVSYPSGADKAAAKARGVHPGGLIMVHGLKDDLRLLGRAHVLLDWTNGCVAVTNREIEEIWRVVPDGTPIVLEP